MPSGRTHDKLTSYASLAIFPAAVILTGGSQSITIDGVLNGAIASLCCWVSGLWLSPDVDVKGYLDRRYGPFQFIWSGYYWLCHLGRHYRVHRRITHRSYLSHSPIVGSLSKVFYLAFPAILLLHWDMASIYTLALNHRIELLASAIGLEFGSLTHIVSDWLWSELH